MGLPDSVTRFGIRLFRSEKGQAFLNRAVNKLDFWRGIGAGAYVESSGEEILFRLVRERKSAATEPVIFDVGANAGDFSSAAFGELGTDIRIYAFEPARTMFQQLSARFLGHRSIVLNHTALGREAGEMALYGTERDTGMASLVCRSLAHMGTAASFQEMVKVISLADYCASSRIERIDLLKIDVEGFELEVLNGAKTLFENGSVGICSFEFGGCNIDSRTFLRDYFEFFEAHRMNLHRITPAGTLVRLVAYHEQLERFTTTNYVALHAGQ